MLNNIVWWILAIRLIWALRDPRHVPSIPGYYVFRTVVYTGLPDHSGILSTDPVSQDTKYLRQWCILGSLINQGS